MRLKRRCFLALRSSARPIFPPCAPIYPAFQTRDCSRLRRLHPHRLDHCLIWPKSSGKAPPSARLKSLLAMRLPGILPPMTDEEALTSAALLSSSAAGFTPAQWKRRPFRAPHHCASAAALAGGGNPPHPGEITLAHHGVLFLDELTEFDRRVLEMLRE